MRLPLPSRMSRSALSGLLFSVAAGCGPESGVTKVYNTAPAVTIQQPPSGTEVEEGEPISFVAQVDDAEQAPEELSLTWTSDLDGLLSNAEVADADGIVTYVTGALSAGNHVITLTATDSEAESDEDSVDVSVLAVAAEPTITIIHPAPGEPGSEFEDFEFVALVGDEQDALTDLLVNFTSDVDGSFCDPVPDEVGKASCLYALSADDHILTYTVTDSDGLSATATVYFEVVADGDEDDDHDGYTETMGDCDDGDDAVYPTADETANGEDDDCDDIIDEETDAYDDDGDCFCEDASCSGSINEECEDVLGLDCDDDDDDIYPDAEETCDGRDNDCDDEVDEGTSCLDDDGDGYTEISGDCDDTSDATYPGATEVPDGEDNDCDGTADEGTTAYDDDGDCYCEDAVCTDSVSSACATVDGGDCDDTDDSVSPDATELCDGEDDDCDGTTDENDAADAVTWYADGDADGYGTTSPTTVACDRPAGYSATNTDCDDANASLSPIGTETCNSVDDDCDSVVDEGVTTTWYKDADGDGYGDPVITSASCSVPTGYVSTGTDCDDSTTSVYPGATETCDDKDNDCDGTTDEGVTTTYYKDTDGDSYGTSSTTKDACSLPSGYSAASTDCDDSKSSINPAATETCNSADDDCDGFTDEGVTTTYYRDADGDGYGTEGTTTSSCSAPTGYVSSKTDCNDASSSVSPAATEMCDTVDNDCDGTTDESSAADASTWYIDSDGDGYGTTTTTKVSCSKPSGYAALATDCNDALSSVSPAATETCNSIDDDCDGTVDDGVTTTYYRDADGDGYGVSTTTYAACSAPTGYVATSGDCDDTSSTYSPATVWYIDYDGDGYGTTSTTKTQCTKPTGYVLTTTDCNDLSSSAYPGATETCDDLDNDCDSSTDESGASGCTTYYYDYDGDGYGSKVVSGVCYCDATGYYTSTVATDCYDYNSSASPAATTYYSTSRGDGSYDYNCDSSASKYYTATYSCDTDWTGFDCDSYTNGYSGSVPACGASGNWRTGCDADWFDCTYTSSSSLTQKCR